MTPAEKRSLKVGNTYILATADNNHHLKVGTVVEFTEDDDSTCPYFVIRKNPPKGLKTGEEVCINIRDVLTLHDKPAEMLDTKAILKKYISTKYPTDTFLDFLVDRV